MRRETLLVLAVPLLQWSLHAESVDEKFQVIQMQLQKLVTMVEEQQKAIQSQQRKLDDQEKMIASVAETKTIGHSMGAEIVGRIERAETQSREAVKIAGRKKPNDLNMAIGAAVDTSYRYFDGNPAKADRAALNDFSMRSAEMVLYADVDPYFKSYMVLNSSPDPKTDEAVPHLEEAAIATTSLQHVQVRGGRFFVPFGRFSMIHDHDLPFVDRPRSLDTYVNGESAGDGVQAQALIPLNHFFQVTGGTFNKIGAGFPELKGSGTRRSGDELTYFFKALTSFDMGDDHTLEAGISAVETPRELIRRDLSNLELTYKWHPAGSTLREKLVWGSEIMREQLRSRFDVPSDMPGLPPVSNRQSRTGAGGYTYAEYFIDPHWSVGPRIDLFENIDPSVKPRRDWDQTYSAFLTYKFSEFSRLRLQYNRHEYFDGQHGNEWLLQWTAFWGAHTHSFDQR